MNAFEIETALRSFTILVDTREQPTPRYKERLAAMGVPCERVKLDFGDYSARVTLPDGSTYDLKKIVSVERKMDIDELCACFCKGRKRFTNEFERAKEAGAIMYLLIEGATWERMYKGDYNSLMKPSALIGSLSAWCARYDCKPVFCQPHTSGRLIRDILYHEMKARLETI